MPRMPVGKRSASTEDEDDGKSTTSKRSRRSESENESDGRRDESANEEVRWTNVVDLRMELECIAEDEEDAFHASKELEVEKEDADMPSPPSVESRGFEYLEHPADILLHAWGTTDGEAMGALIESLYGVLTELESIEEVYSYEMEAEGETEDVLIFNTLQEALFAFQAEPYFVGRRVEVLDIEKDAKNGTMKKVNIRGWGESFEMGKHVQKNDVKAPTYSNMQIKREKDRVDLYVVVDGTPARDYSSHSDYCKEEPIMVNVEKKVFKRKLQKMKKAAEMSKKKKEVTEEVEKEVKKEEESDEEDGDDSDVEHIETPAKMMKKVEEPKMDDDSNDLGSILSGTTFDSLEGKVSSETLATLKDMGFTKMTEIQAKSIGPLLEGKDVLASAKTGSGKTLGFLVPCIELLVKMNWKARNGTGVIIISPTRELSIQTYGVLSELLKAHPSLTHGLIMGGSNRNTEADKLSKGISILVATPGRLLDHLVNTKDFSAKNMKCLVIDEADRILDIGFEVEMQQILRRLPAERQTMLFSATHTPKVDELVKLALHSNPIKVGVEQKTDQATVAGLSQGYVVCPSEKRFLLLFTFLKKNRNKKVMVFFSSCAAVKYYHELLNYIDVPAQCIHGKQKQQKRTTTFFQFCQAETGILLCTDVAARGLDIPAVDWIVQYDPPDEPREYIHRVGRTARGQDGKGHALLILRPEELAFLRFLRAERVVLNEFDFSWAKVSNIQSQLEKLISENYYLNKSAKEAYKGYVRAYDSHSHRDCFDVTSLDLLAVSKSFGFAVPPFVDLPITHKPKMAGRGDTQSYMKGSKPHTNQKFIVKQMKKRH